MAGNPSPNPNPTLAWAAPHRRSTYTACTHSFHACGVAPAHAYGAAPAHAYGAAPVIFFCYKPMLSSTAPRLQLTKERKHLTVRKEDGLCGAIPFQHFPKINMIFKKCSDFNSSDTSVREIPMSEAKMTSDRKVGFSRNLENELWKCQGH